DHGDLDELLDTLGAGGADRASLGTALPILADWRRRRQAESVVDSWRYRVDWTVVADPPVAALDGTWLFAVPPESAEAEAVRDALAGAGADVVAFPVAATDDRATLADRLRATGITSAGTWPAGTWPAGIVSLLATDERPGGPETDALETDAPGLAGSL